MTLDPKEEYDKKRVAIFAEHKIPDEFQAPIEQIAYEYGHAYGYHEVLIHLGDIVYALKEPIKNFEKRVRTEA